MADQVLHFLVEKMTKVGELNISGKDKKELVLQFIEEKLSDVIPDELEFFLDILIDLLIDVEKGKIIFNPKTKKLVKSCFSCLKR